MILYFSFLLDSCCWTENLFHYDGSLYSQWFLWNNYYERFPCKQGNWLFEDLDAPETVQVLWLRRHIKVV
jgi:hypothetical protein